jgi:hypothetical protein
MMKTRPRLQALRHAQPTVPPQAISAPTLDLIPQPGVLGVFLGGYGQRVARALHTIEAEQGYATPKVVLDNDVISRQMASLADGSPCSLPESSCLGLTDDTPRRTRIMRDAPLQAYFQESGLLRSVPVSFNDARAGHGGGAWPINSAIDFTLHSIVIAGKLDGALQRAVAPSQAPAEGTLHRLRSLRETVRELPLFIVVIAGGTGSFGTGVSPLIPYLLRERAEELGLPRPELWLLLAGPNAFRDYTSRWQRNYSATIRAIEHLDRHGLDVPLADGARLTRGEPAYDNVWLLDEPRQRTKPTDQEADAFAWRGALTAQLLLQGSVRDAYLGHAANEGEERPGHFGTAAVGLGGADRAALTVGLADALALAQGQMLATMLQPA